MIPVKLEVLLVLCPFLKDSSLCLRRILCCLSLALLTRGSGLKVTQEPLFSSKWLQESLKMSCTVDQSNSDFYWYRQLPGQTKLEHIGTLLSYDKTLKDIPEELKDRLNSSVKDKTMHLNLIKLQSSDTGLYLCSSKDTVNQTGIGAGINLTARQLMCFFRISARTKHYSKIQWGLAPSFSKPHSNQ
uniref:Ig-like domain-containing protein n=1 Tax=Salvator merianae TaxID=96440 RepID=A0A8D0B4R3_SALMN